MSEANNAVLRDFVESVNTQNWDRLRSLLDPHFVRHSNAGGTEIRSAEELISYLKNEYATFPDAEETLLDLVAEGESVAARSRFRGTQAGSLGSYPPSGTMLCATYSRSTAWREGGLPKHGPNGTTCVGCNSSAISMQRNPPAGNPLPSGGLPI